ncbi:Uu.00g098270.m01.CDS01 [Anthostomella pinea]|uniref:Uu.00g098270.m01.CDS01 n=1 Tax=Anthostomella pinea TaxID=933095 RepID=A0AAI8V7H8_9PEZI|nr:Uu.00g098270.m01.CDS01 [Anthostomella pinea]
MSSDRHRSVNWRARIQSELVTFHGSEQQARWDPFESGRFSSQQEINAFYSGQRMRAHNIHDRERAAAWLIEQALGPNPEANIRLTGMVMQDKTVTRQTGVQQVPRDIYHAVLTDGQQDVDAEEGKDAKATNGDDEVTQTVGAAAQAVLSASPNSLGPPITPCATYLRMTKCGEYGRNKSNVWKSPLFTNLDNEDGRRGLLDHQVTGIVWIMQRLFGELPRLRFTDPDTGEEDPNPETAHETENRERLRGPKYSGGIYADSMGLGKTLTTISCLGLVVDQQLNWVQEINDVIDDFTIRHIVVSGKGVQVPRDQNRIVSVEGRQFNKNWPADLKYIWDEMDPQAAQAVLVMTIDTWSGRTCSQDTDADAMWHSSFTDCRRGFSVVVVDEAYKIKNSATRNWRSVQLLKRESTLLITATPCMNSLTDLLGPTRLLWPGALAHLKQQGTWERIKAEITSLQDLAELEGLDSWDDFQLVAGRPAILSKMLHKERGARNHNIQLTREYLKYLETLAMLRRSSSSFLYYGWDKKMSVSLEGLFPHVDHYTVDIQPGATFERLYQERHVDLFIKYMEVMNEWSSKQNKKKGSVDKKILQSAVTTHRHFQIAASSMDVDRLEELLSANDFGTKAEHVATMRHKGVNFLRLAQFLQERGGPKPEKCVDFISLAVQNSPILWYILYYIKENILDRPKNAKIKKLLIIENVPILAFYYELVLQLLGFNCRVLHSDLSNESRQELIESFNSDKVDSTQLLIQMYTVGFAGTNLHKNCHLVLIAAQAHAFAVQWQTIHRVIRVGQMSDVKVYRIKVNNTYHAFRESRQLEKLLPELASRAETPVLVKLLNLFQPEVDKAWLSPEAKQLMEDKNLLSDRPDNMLEDQEEQADEERDKKRVKLEGESTVRIKHEEPDDSAEDPDDDEEASDDDSDGAPQAEEDSHPGSSTNSKVVAAKRKRDEPEDIPEELDGHAGWFNDFDENDEDAAFLVLRTREEYYDEIKRLPRMAKSFFEHKKNALRRLLSYGSPNKNAETRVWTADDLKEHAVLERALELTMKVKLGAADDIAMLPHPQIDLSLVPEEKRKKLQRLLARATNTDQDFHAAAEPTVKKSLLERENGADHKASLDRIEFRQEAETLYGGSSAKAKTAMEKHVRRLAGEEVSDDDGEEILMGGIPDADQGYEEDDEDQGDEIDEAEMIDDTIIDKVTEKIADKVIENAADNVADNDVDSDLEIILSFTEKKKPVIVKHENPVVMKREKKTKEEGEEEKKKEEEEKPILANQKKKRVAPEVIDLDDDSDKGFSSSKRSSSKRSSSKKSSSSSRKGFAGFNPAWENA